MKQQLPVLCLTLAVLLGSAGGIYHSIAGEIPNLKLNSQNVPEAGFTRYRECYYDRILTTDEPSKDTSPIFSSWKRKKLPGLVQINLEWKCDRGAKGERIFLISCKNKMLQMYSAFQQSELEIKIQGYMGLIDNYTSSPPPIKKFGETYGYGVSKLPNYLIKKICP